MGDIFKKSAKLFGKTIIINILSLLVVVSIVSISVVGFAEAIGYSAFGQKGEKGEVVHLYDYYYEDGDDLKLKEYEAEGYTITKNKIKEVPPKKYDAFLIIAQVFTLGILISFIYPDFWDMGYKHRNMALSEKMAPDPLKGLKIGLIAQIPALLLIIVFKIIGTSSTAVFKILNASVYSAIELLTKGINTFEGIAAWKLIVFGGLLMIVPLVAFAGYYLGYKDFSIGEKFIYKRRKKEN